MLNEEELQIKNETENKILSDIQEYGWSVINVLSEDNKIPSFAYSAGIFRSLEAPEIIIYAMEAEDAQKIINKIGNYIKSGSIIEKGKIYKEFIEDSWPCTFIEVEKEYYGEYLGFNNWLYRLSDFPALQCVWADEKGSFPWNKEFNPSAQHLQVILGKI
jgi:hypothetical protein